MWGRPVSDGGAPNDRAGKTHPELRITLEAVQLCEANADRLLSDSKNVSEPTAVALAELALEEVLKGWVLLFHRTDAPRDSDVSRSVQLLVADDESLREFLDTLRGISPKDLFRSHEAKLRALEPALRLIEGSLSKMESGSPGPLLQKEALKTRISVKWVRQYEKADLRKLAESGLYVDRTKDGWIFSPSSSYILVAAPFREVVATLLFILKAVTLTAAGVVPIGKGT